MALLTSQDTLLGRVRYLVDNVLAQYSQAEVARRIGIDPSNMSKYMAGKLPVSRSLLNKFVVELGVSKEWLFDGEGVPYEKPTAAEKIDGSEVTVVEKRGIPVYDLDVTAGCHPLDRLLTEDRVAGFVDLPRINRDSVIVRVSGDSMEPKIIDGGYVAIRPVKSVANIFWGQIYVIVMEDYRMVKILRRHPSNPDMVVLHSENPNYDDMDVNRGDIQNLFLVETIINCKNLC